MLGRLKERLKSPRAKLFAVAGTLLAVPGVVYAFDIIGAFWGVIAAIFEFGTKLMGFILISLVKLLISVAQYQNFVAPGPTAVQIGWVVTRDLANMFFILILLIIAFGTIVGYEEYHYRSRLPRLFLMAIVINFSKTICGIFIDMGQVIMLTFVNGFAQAAGGNFLNAFQVNKLLQLRASGEMSASGLALGMALAFIMVTVATNVVLVMLIMMTFRIIYLWVLIILSPIAFLASAFPPAQQYYGQWWSEFRKYITSGPIVAFFLWLALLSVQRAPGCKTSNGSEVRGVACDGFLTSGASASDAEVAQQRSSTGIPTEAAGEDAILSLIIVTGILMAGLKVAKETGAAGVGTADMIKGKIKGVVGGVAKAGFGAAGRFVAGNALSGVGRALGSGPLGRIPVLGSLARVAGVQGDRMRDKQRKSREAFREKVSGTASEQAKASPVAFANRLAKETDPAKKAGMLKSLSEDPKAMARIGGNDGAVRSIAKDLDAGRKTNPGLDKNYKEFVKANWKSGGLSDDQKKDAFKSFGADDAAKLTAGDIQKNSGLVPSMSSEGFNQLMSKGTQEQRQAMEKVLGDQKTIPEGAQKFLAKKKADPTALSADALEGVDGAAAYALERGRKDPAQMDEMMADGRKAEALRASAAYSFNKHDTPSSDMTIDSIRTNAIDAGKIEADAEVNAKVGNSVNPPDMLKRLNMNDPKQRAAGQAAWGAFEKANPERAKKLADTGNYNDFIKPNKTGGAGQTTAVRPPAGGAAQSGQPKPPAQPAAAQGNAGLAQAGREGAAQIKQATQEIASAARKTASEIGTAGETVSSGMTAGGEEVAQSLKQSGASIGAAGANAADEAAEGIKSAGESFQEAGERAAGAVDKTGEDIGRATKQATRDIKQAGEDAKKKP